MICNNKVLKRYVRNSVFIILSLFIVGCYDNKIRITGDWAFYSDNVYYECHVDKKNFIFFYSFFKDQISKSESGFNDIVYYVRKDTLFFNSDSEFLGSPFRILSTSKDKIYLQTLGDNLNDTIVMKRLEKNIFSISDIQTAIDSTKYMFHFYNRKNAFYGDSFKVNVDSITDAWIKSSFEIDTIEMHHVILDSIVYDSSDLQSERQK